MLWRCCFGVISINVVVGVTSCQNLSQIHVTMIVGEKKKPAMWINNDFAH